jgi:hypothetical protein
MEGRLAEWKKLHLSNIGRNDKNIISSLPTYFMSLLKCPILPKNRRSSKKIFCGGQI